ncbi:MAG: hypothetical protein V2I33_25410, partial [Kangiellaceae bacterium]|nr:hypothetical protein [Kangiellaceae bacterium]
HWEKTVLFNEFMTGNNFIEDPVFSTLTEAWLYDTTWYAPNKPNRWQDMQFGRGQGLAFLQNRGLSCGLFDEYCTSSEPSQCSRSKTYKSRCSSDSLNGCSIWHEIDYSGSPK